MCAAAYVVTLRLALRYFDAPLAHTAAAAVAVLAGAACARIRRRRAERVLSQPPGLRCPRCRYNLKFNPGRCPECGSPCIANTGRFAEVKPAVPDVRD